MSAALEMTGIEKALLELSKRLEALESKIAGPARALTYDDAAGLLTVSQRTVRQLVARGRLSVVRYDESAQPRIPMSEIVRLTSVAEQPPRPEKPERRRQPIGRRGAKSEAERLREDLRRRAREARETHSRAHVHIGGRSTSDRLEHPAWLGTPVWPLRYDPRVDDELDGHISRWLCHMVFDVRFFTTEAGRCQSIDFLDSLPSRDRAQIVADITTFGEHGLQAPISLKAIKGRPNRGLYEIRTGKFRTLFCQKGRVVWVLHVCRKQDQRAGIEVARARMKEL